MNAHKDHPRSDKRLPTPLCTAIMVDLAAVLLMSLAAVSWQGKTVLQHVADALTRRFMEVQHDGRD